MTDQITASASDTLAADWAIIWQSEWAAIAVDPEVQEAWERMMAAWAMQADAVQQAPTLADAAARSAWSASSPRAAAAADAPDARDVAIAGLLDRVAELERRGAKPAGKVAAKPAADPAGG